MEDLIIKTQAVAKELYILNEKKGTDPGCEELTEENVFYMNNYYRFYVAFDNDNDDFKVWVSIFDESNEQVITSRYTFEVSENSFEEALSHICEDLSQELEKAKGRDGEIIEDDGKKYRLTLVP